MSHLHLPETMHEIKLRLPQTIVERLESAVESQHIPMEQVVMEALDIALPPARIRAQADERLQAAIERLSGLSAAQWQAHTKAEMTPAEKQQAAELLAKSKTGTLSPEEVEAMQALIERNEAVATERAAALWLLRPKRRE